MRPFFALALLSSCSDPSSSPSDSGPPPVDGAAGEDGSLPGVDGGEGEGEGEGEPPGRLAEEPIIPLSHAPGSGLATALVTGRIYDDLSAHAAERFRDFAALGVRALRIEIERDTPWDQYRAILDAAQSAGITILGLVSANTMAADAPGPLDGDIADFDSAFVPAYIAALDDTMQQLPGLAYVEVWNEPDVYGFAPMFDWHDGICAPREGATRYALLAVRVFETLNERRLAGTPTPTIAAFGVSRQDDSCLRTSLVDSDPVTNHRLYYRPAQGWADGLPTDIVAIHGYGNPRMAPWDDGYTYGGGTFADGVDAFLSATFADDGDSVIGDAPVWYTEVGYSISFFDDRPDPDGTQRDALVTVFDELRQHPNVTAVFWYDYRDDELGAGSEGNHAGLRESSDLDYAAHPSYEAFQDESVASGDRTAPAGAIDTPASGSTFAPGASVPISGWSIDADGQAPSIDIAVDGQVVLQGGAADGPSATGCAVAHSWRCPNVAFAADVVVPAAPGPHEIAARARDAAGNARVIGRVDVIVSR